VALREAADQGHVLPGDVVDQPVAQEAQHRLDVQPSLIQVLLQPVELRLETRVQPGVGGVLGATVLPDPVFLMAEVVIGIRTQLRQQPVQIDQQSTRTRLLGAQQQIEQHLVLQVDGGHTGFQCFVPGRGQPPGVLRVVVHSVVC